MIGKSHHKIDRGRLGNPKIVKFTRKDTQFSSPITNQKIIATSVECSTSQDGLDFLTCIFHDELGSKKSLSNIIFTNYEVDHPIMTSYKNSENGLLVHQINFERPTICEVMGHNRYGLTMKCTSKASQRLFESGQSRNKELIISGKKPLVYLP